jgi:hypothetical protein
MIISKTGVIICLNDFKCFDKLNEKEECKRLEITSEGEMVAAFFEPGHGSFPYWEIIKRGLDGEKYDRPRGYDSEPNYYLKAISEAREAGANTENIKYLIGLYEMTLKHEKIDAQREAEEKNEGKFKKTKYKKRRQIYKY